MSTVTLSQVTESIRKLPADKLMVVYDFISYLTAQGAAQTASPRVSRGLPVAVLIPVEAYEQLVARSRSKAAFHDFAYHLGREVETRGLTEEEFLADLEQTKREVFTEQYGRST
jgi:hypothetical protein